MLLVAAAVMATGLATGCKSKEEKACLHLQEVAAAKGRHDISMEACLKDLADVKQRCSNPDDVFDCFQMLESVQDLVACYDMCQEVGK